jgi:hypothetical protein
LSHNSQFAGSLKRVRVFQFPACARRECGPFPVHFRHSAVRNRTPESRNLSRYASVYLLGIQLFGLFPRFRASNCHSASFTTFS